MAREIVMPKLGLTMVEGYLAKWFVKEGDEISVGDKLLLVETDKLTNEVMADQAGVLIRKMVEEGSTVPVKTLLGVIGEAGETYEVQESQPTPSVETKEAAPAAVVEKKEKGTSLATPYAKKLARDRGVKLEDIQGSGYEGVICARDIPEVRDRKATPLAKKIAQDQGVDLSTIPGEGRIYSRDLVQAQEGRKEPVSTMRRVIAQHLGKTWAETPMVTFHTKVNATALVETRERLKKALAKKDLKLSYTHLLIYAVSRVLQHHPELNASFTEEEILYHDHVNMGIAVDVGSGLLVPNLKGAESMRLGEIVVKSDALIRQAKEGGLSPDDLSGGTFTITNLGMFSIDGFTPIINKPEVAILGVGRMTQSPVVVEGEINIAPIMTLSLTADHSLVDGAVAARFLTELQEVLEEPTLLFL